MIVKRIYLELISLNSIFNFSLEDLGILPLKLSEKIETVKIRMKVIKSQAD